MQLAVRIEIHCCKLKNSFGQNKCPSPRCKITNMEGKAEMSYKLKNEYSDMQRLHNEPNRLRLYFYLITIKLCFFVWSWQKQLKSTNLSGRERFTVKSPFITEILNYKNDRQKSREIKRRKWTCWRGVWTHELIITSSFYKYEDKHKVLIKHYTHIVR